MSQLYKFKALQVDVGLVQKKLEKALLMRARFLQKINSACEALKLNPIDQAARNTLRINLRGERRFLKIIRSGLKEGISILEYALKEIDERFNADPNLKNQMSQLTQFLIDAFKFARGKIKIVEGRIKMGEELEKRDYHGEYLAAFMQTMAEEEAIDQQLQTILANGDRRHRGMFEMLRVRLNAKTTDIPVKLAGIAGFGTIVGVAAKGGGDVQSFAIPLLLIIGMSYGIMVGLSKQLKAEEDRRRRGKEFA